MNPENELKEFQLFKALKNSKKPTGDPTCPPEIKRSKHIQRMMEGRMAVVQFDGQAQRRPRGG